MRSADAVVLLDALDRYVSLRRFAVSVLESLDRALGSQPFEPSGAATVRQSENEHDPGVVLVELLADVANALANHADRVAAEERLRTRRRAVAAATLLGVGAWCWRRRARA
jgi:hypothetical protein